MQLVVSNAQGVYSALRAANNKVSAEVKVAVLMVYEQVAEAQGTGMPSW